ncbi:MAG: HEAT repeat domain-containing protein [Saprospiraceae bacterium]|nr:HEAT repeat domain-containing protein [Saprospiraceae bacterium]
MNQHRFISGFLSTVILVASLQSCLPPDFNFNTNRVTQVDFSLTNPSTQAIYDLQDQQKVDSLILLMSDENANTRYWAAMAFASIKLEKAVDALLPLLKDEVLDVRIAAAYALGQIGKRARKIA